MKFTLRAEKDVTNYDCSRNLVYGSDYSSMVVGRVVRLKKPLSWAKGKRWCASIAHDGSGYAPFKTMKEARQYIEKTFTREILEGR